MHCPPLTLPELESVTQADGKRYYTTPAGKRLPSVTTVVGAKSKQSIMEWRNRVGDAEANRVSKIASGRGNRVHKLAERYLKDEKIDWIKEMPDAVKMFRSIIKEMQNINNIHYIEQALWSESIGLAGRVDLIAEWQGKLSIIDFKTSKRVKNEEDIQNYFAQCVSYSLMYEELVGVPVDQFVILMAVEDEEPQVFVKNTSDYVDVLFDHIKYYHENKL